MAVCGFGLRVVVWGLLMSGSRALTDSTVGVCACRVKGFGVDGS